MRTIIASTCTITGADVGATVTIPLTGGCSEGLDVFRFFLNNSLFVFSHPLYFIVRIA